MKQLEKEKAGFMRVLVHELKSPVAASKMMAEALGAVRPDDSQVTKMTGRITARLDGLHDLIQDVLNLAKVKQGGTLGDIQAMDFAEVLREACVQYQEQAETKGLGFDLDVPETPVPIRFDTNGVQLVVSNLVSNAVKYTLEGTVRVRLFIADDRAVLQVKDSGIGIPEQDIPSLFREFFRASNAKKSKIQGTGVGLAGVKQIVERFSGQMALTSEENVGSTFTVTLPTCPEEDLHADGDAS